MSRVICVPLVRKDQKRFITYSINVLSPIVFGNSLKIFWFMLSGKYVEFTLKGVFVGRQVGESDQLLNYLFILAKLHIWNCRKRRVPPT